MTTITFVPQVRKFAIDCRVADKPNGRRLHTHAIPHLGGIAIFGGFFLGLLVSLGIHAAGEYVARVLALLPALVIVFGLGLVDDLRGLRAGVKLSYQVLAAVCVVAMGTGFQLAEASNLARAVLLAATSVVWYVGICNSVNLIDGLDGLAAGTATLAAVGFLAVGMQVGDPSIVVVSLCLIGALVAFLRFNFHPARIFMGDTGSMFTGFTLAAMACLLARHLGFWTAILGSTAMLGLPILDTLSAIFRRVAARRPIFQADGDHTHHKLMRAGLSHRGAVLLLYAIAGTFMVLGCGVLLGHMIWFAWAVALGISVALGVSLVARRAHPVGESPASFRLARRPRAAGRPQRVPEPMARRVMTAPPARAQSEDNVLAGLPPAVSGPS